MDANQNFILEHQTAPIASIALLLSKRPELDKDYILRQINGLQKSKDKLPEWYATEGLQFPVGLSMEQCSSEETAKFKAQLVAADKIVDLTGGFGVDSYYLSQKAEKLTYIEQNIELFDLVMQNFACLSANNIEGIATSAEAFLNSSTTHFDLAYIDPARRDAGKKVFLLEDCSPDIVGLQSQILKIASKILVKTSPLLDIKLALQSLKNVSKVYVIALKNECKELLFLMDSVFTGIPEISAVNLQKDGIQVFNFNYNQEIAAQASYAAPSNYLYEPNAAILKAGAFQSIALHFGLTKVAPNSHLYSSDSLVEDFPGRCFHIQRQVPFDIKAFQKLKINKANLTTRNFKLSVAELRKKLKLKDGGELYIFATTLKDGKAMLILCEKVS